MRICPKKINEGSEENILDTKSFSRSPRRPMQGPSFRLKRTHYLGARQCGFQEIATLCLDVDMPPPHTPGTVGAPSYKENTDFGIVLLGKAGVGLKILEKLVYQEACSVISQLQVHFDSKIGLLSRAGAVIVVTNKDKQFLFITFLRV